MNNEIILYDYVRSTASLRVRIVLEYKSLDYKLESVHLVEEGGEQHRPDYKEMNPFSLVPTLKIGYDTFYQSLAIIQYLDDRFPKKPLLPKSDPMLKSQILSFSYAIACDLHPLNNLRVLQYLENTLKVTPSEKTTWYHHWLTQCFDGLERMLAMHVDEYCFGDFSLADIALVAQVYNAIRFDFNLGPYPIIRRIYQDVVSLPFVAAVFPQK